MPSRTIPFLIAEPTGWAMSNTFWLQVVNHILMNQAWPRWYLVPINTILSFSSCLQRKLTYRVLSSVQLPVTSGCVLSVSRIARVYLPPRSCGHSAEPFTLSSNTLSLSVWYISKWVCLQIEYFLFFTWFFIFYISVSSSCFF